MINLFYKHMNYNGYASQARITPLNFDSYFHIVGRDIVQEKENTIVVTDTRADVPSKMRTILRLDNSTHVMIVDCDSMADMALTCHTLVTRGMKYALIESSPGRYWVITDYINCMKAIRKQLETMPGVDRQWVDMNHSQLYIRAMPQDGRLPNMPDLDVAQAALQNDYAFGWYKQFYEFYHTPEVIQLADLQRMQAARKSPEHLQALISDPAFTV